MTPNTLATAMGIPLQRATIWAEALTSAMRFFEINTPQRVAAFIAQIGHESGGLSRLEEDFNYTAERLCQVWPMRFYMPPELPTLYNSNGVIVARDRVLAEHYQSRPIAVGNLVYANRLGNGDEGSGDGYTYRGRGPIQLTGHINYMLCGETIGYDIAHSPGLVIEPAVGALTAGWFWRLKGCNELADAGKFEALTSAINGGLIGIVDRELRYSSALTALRNVPPDTDVA